METFRPTGTGTLVPEHKHLRRVSVQGFEKKGVRIGIVSWNLWGVDRRGLKFPVFVADDALLFVRSRNFLCFFLRILGSSLMICSVHNAGYSI